MGDGGHPPPPCSQQCQGANEPQQGISFSPFAGLQGLLCPAHLLPVSWGPVVTCPHSLSHVIKRKGTRSHPFSLYPSPIRSLNVRIYAQLSCPFLCDSLADLSISCLYTRCTHPSASALPIFSGTLLHLSRPAFFLQERVMSTSLDLTPPLTSVQLFFSL